MSKKVKNTNTKQTRVILIKDVEKVGQKGQIIDVKRGFAKNYLLPQNLAQVASPQAIARASKQQAKEASKLEAKRNEIQELANSMDNKTVKVAVKVGEKDQVFGSVGPAEIATAMKSQHQVEVSPLQIKLDKPIKTLGEHPTVLKLEEGVTTTINVILEQEK